MKRRIFIQNVTAGIGLTALGLQSKAATHLGSNNVVPDFLQSEGRFIYQKSAQSEQVFYHAVLNTALTKGDLAFLKQQGGSDVLLYQTDKNSDPQVIAEMDFCFSPLLVGDMLFWVEGNGNNWKIGAAELSNLEKIERIYPFKTEGRPNSLFAFEVDGVKYLLWEERQGVDTRVAIATISGKKISQPEFVTDGKFNAYDPVGTIDSEGVTHVVYSAFYEGQYRIMHQERKPGKAFSKPDLISDSANACMYPSVCKHKVGGVWVSYTDFQMPADFEDWDIPYSQHLRRTRQHDFFRSKAFTRLVHFQDGILKAPNAPQRKGGKEGNISAGLVFGSEFSKRSQVFEDETGRVGVVVRKHQDYGETLFGEDNQLLNKGLKSHKVGMNNRSDLVMILYDDQCWRDPVTLIRRAHFETPISIRMDKQRLNLAFTEDGRRTGWGKSGERFDSVNEIGVGLCSLSVFAKEPEYDFRLISMRPTCLGDMQEPVVDNLESEYRTIFGQTHLHTENSVCTRAYDQNYHSNYRFIQDAQRCRFAGITDHCYNMGPCEQHHMRKMAEYYYFPGEFVALQAYEWTSGKGHINPLGFEENQTLAVFSPYAEDEPGNTHEKMWREYRGVKVVAPPHHMTSESLPFYWEYFNDEFMPVVEIFQDRRGSTEQANVAGLTNYARQEEGFWTMDELLKNKKFGFIAAGDHSGLALAGVIVKDLTRTGLYDAFMNRNCFGTTGNHLVIQFGTDQVKMGGSQAKPMGSFKLKVLAPELIEQIEIVRDGITERIEKPNAEKFEKSWNCKKGITFCRIIQQNGDVSWTSPIWVG